jgi:hypothetical protein
MQEHEYVYEQEQTQEHTSERESEQIKILSMQESEQTDEDTASESFGAAYDLAELRDQRATLLLGRVLVIGLGLSFLACLAALWFSSTLISAPDQVLPVAFLQMLAANRLLVLCVPAVCLVICYIALRSLTGEITAVPEHRLDERQKVLRDQAHRSAFKIIKFACVLIPGAFLLPHLPMFNSPAPMPVPNVGMEFTLVRGAVFNAQGSPFIVVAEPGGDFGHLHRFGQVIFYGGYGFDQVPVQTAPAISPANALEIGVAGGLLLVALLLILSALPMAVLAWKGKV